MARQLSPEQVQERIRNMLSLERQEELDPFRVMAFLPIEAHHVVADIGCGPGFFSLPLAKFLVHGKLYAVDVSPEMLDALRQRVQDTFLGNVELVLSETEEPRLEPESLDGALVAFVLHEVERRQPFLSAVARALRPGGWLGVVEVLPRAPGDIPAQRRLDPEELRGLAKDSGLRFQEWRELNGKHYLALLRRPRPKA